MIYDTLEELIVKQKGSDALVLMGDWNAVVGETGYEKVAGTYGLGNQNARGLKLIEFCKRRDLVVMNTWFRQEKRRLYTWQAPGHGEKYQIDYIMVKQRYRNVVKKVCTLPGADAETDHNLLAATIRMRLKRIRKTRRRKKWNLDKLSERKMEFANAVNMSMQNVVDHNPDDGLMQWEILKHAVKEAAEKEIGMDTR